MNGKIKRFGVIVAAVLAMSLIVAASAMASVHVTSVTAISPTLSASLVSTGDAGWNHGNENWAMSPILPAPSPDFAGWFNQNVMFSNLVLTDPDFDGDVILGGSWWNRSTNGTTWGPDMPFTDGAIGSAEGLYSINATGADDTTPAPDFVVTGTIVPAFGIDKTAPVSMSDLPKVPAGDPDAVPVLSGDSVMVTISATDTLSGVENLLYSADGAPMDYAWDADPGSMFTVPVAFTPGVHTLSWKVFDNAGNVDSHSELFIVRPSVFTPFVGLIVKQSGSRSRTVKFSGEVDAVSANMPLKITIKRWNGKKWVSFMSITKTMPKFWDDYSVTVKINRAGRFQAVTTFAGGTSKARTFRTR